MTAQDMTSQGAGQVVQTTTEEPNGLDRTHAGNHSALCVPTLVWRQSKQMRPELTTCRTESVLVPYKFFSNSPNSMNFPLAKSDSKAARLTKWYSRPFRSWILKFLVVSEPQKEHGRLHSQLKGPKIMSTKMHKSRQICVFTFEGRCHVSRI